MNRADLRWALDAVIPHAGTREAQAAIGIDITGGYAYVYAGSKYSQAVAWIHDDSPRVDVKLSSREARELLRYVRPSLVAEHEQSVVLLATETELHVGIGDDSAVFELRDAPITRESVVNLILTVNAIPDSHDQLVFEPDLFAKASKAKRYDTDRLRIYPKKAIENYGVALVTVGDSFACAVAGLTYDDRADAPLLPFLEGLAP